MAIIGEIKLFTYDDVPDGYMKCCGQSIKVHDYPKLYMMIGAKYGREDELHFSLPDLRGDTPNGMSYCIAFDGEIPKI